MVVPISTREELKQLAARLHFPRKWPHGRLVQKVGPFAQLLRVGDRLQPSHDVPDLLSLDSIDVSGGAFVYFLRVLPDSIINGAPWLWSVPGIHDDGIDHFTGDCVAGDICHTLDLGQIQRFGRLSLRPIIDANVFGSSKRTKPEREHENIV